MMVSRAFFTEIILLSSTIDGGSLVLAHCARVICWVELLLISDREVNFISNLVLRMRANEEVILKSVFLCFAFNEHGVQLSNILFESAHATQIGFAHEESEDFVGLNVGVYVDMSTIEDEIFQRNAFAGYSFDVVLIEVSSLDDHIGFEILT